jgi:hypothetical protein
MGRRFFIGTETAGKEADPSGFLIAVGRISEPARLMAAHGAAFMVPTNNGLPLARSRVDRVATPLATVLNTRPSESVR